MKLLCLLTVFYICYSIGEGSELLKRLRKINNKFGFKVFKEVISQDKNDLFSPYNVLSALGMIYRGSSGVSYDEITRALHLGTPGEDLVGATLHLAIKEFRKTVAGTNQESKLYVANRIFSQKGYEISKNYKKALRYYYGTTVQELDFSKNPTKSINLMNSWVMGETDFKIRSTVHPPLDKNLLMMLVNAAYFKGSWENEFSGTETTKKIFKTDDSTMTNVDMMKKEMQVEYCYSMQLRAKAIRLKYKGDGLSMVLLLPDKVSGIETLVRELSEESATEIFNKLTKTGLKNVEVQLPKFTLEEESHNLEEKLTAMGMGSLFSKNANFSLMNPQSSIRLTKVIQKAYVRVDEKGSEAADVSSLTARIPSFVEPSKFTFHATHPFLFLITKSEPDDSELILFIGKVIHPSV